MDKTSKRPRDPNQLAKKIAELATMDEAERAAIQKKAAAKKAPRAKKG